MTYDIKLSIYTLYSTAYKRISFSSMLKKKKKDFINFI